MAVLQKIDNPYGMIQTVEHCESFSIYRSQDSTGDCEVTVYPVFSGIELVYYDVHMQSCDINLAKGRECSSSRIVRRAELSLNTKTANIFTLRRVILSIQKNTENIRHRYCPLSHYHGVSVAIDMNRVPRCFSCILDDVFVSPEELEMKFCSEKPYSIMRENISIEHIFSELYSVPENIRKGYHKVKVLELLLFLSGLEYKGESEERRYFSTLTGYRRKKRPKKYLLAHLDEHITITELADMLGISSTSLKICFKGVYGDTINGYITNCKMQKAASLLKNTDKSVLEIAGIVGYNNGSKFAGAFRRVMNKSPNEYRKSLV